MDPDPCQAIVDDYDRPAYAAPRQRIFLPGDKPCSRRATDQVKHLRLCSTHARMAREGLIDRSGRVEPKASIRDVRRFPEKFPHGLNRWQLEGEK